MANLAITFCELPDELILETIRHLSSIRSYEPQSTAFKDKERERARQFENGVRQLALHSICLTSHRFRRIATPTLYASFLGSATLHGFDHVKLFYRTVSIPGYAVGLKVRLAEYVQYVENRLSDHLGNSLCADTEYYDTVIMVVRYFSLLADVIKQAPNVQHLSVVSLEAEQVSFWNHILPSHYSTLAPSSSKMVADHGFRKLQTLCVQIHMGGYALRADLDWFRNICSAMTSVPSLADLRVSGVMTSGSFSPISGSFKSLKRIEITECVLSFDEVVDIWSACEGLRHIACEWAYYGAGDEPWELYSGLLQHTKTLETLTLDMREVRFMSNAAPPLFGSLRSFAHLESLVICETLLRVSALPLLEFPDQLLQHRITELLPEQMKSFALLLYSNDRHENEPHDRLDEILALWNVVEDCKTTIPSLKVVSVICGVPLCAPKLKEAFNKVGVQFEVIQQAKIELPC
ncbi:uncharacterized protein K460DRAFT_329100 [Cucurbitaria berberidis CBS 394.84]|uniref:Uncharacterized protein n=1 Tax=Cucurbitaria berberidis CBS 394.84 TaxID=1168544 RepID=A0A9P4GRI7_9PLEO|nr:uncharacterized protein K460DRAFT_329100 [Cucurbitaria berberidis CBS 394.84]KAF1851263.1 hypothetical protein K460DRAFT_329100 [Cucurbitaria berberidis CBS 394.84]